MRQFIISGSLIAACLVGQSHAQEMTGPLPDDTPMPPVKLWAQCEPRSTAASDSRFTQIVRWNISALNARNNDCSGTAVANQMAYMIHTAGLTAGRVALMPIKISAANFDYSAYVHNTNTNQTFRIPALFAHEDDCLIPDDEEENPLATLRTPWMCNGIAEASTWMSAFVAQLDVKVDAEYIPAPDRFLFDDEVNDIFYHAPLTLSNLQNVVDYWTLIKADARFSTTCVPGFGGDTLEDLWIAANLDDPYVPANATPPETFNYHLPGGTASNARWVVWFRNVMRQAEAGAMQTAFYDVIHGTFPAAKCSDYDRSIRLEFNDDGDNTWFGGDQNGADGIRYAWDGKGDLQAPCLYPQGSTYFYDSSYNTDPFALSNDEANVLNWCPYEPVGILSSRNHRFVLDSAVRAYGGAYKDTLAPWVILPGQLSFATGPEATVTACNPPENTTLDGTFAGGIPYTAQFSDVRRTLAQVRAHGSSEVNIWNNNTFGADVSGLTYPLDSFVMAINDGVHPQRDYAWSRFPLLVDQVWGFIVYSAHVAAGSTYSGTSGPIHSLACSFGDYLTITSATSGTYSSEVQTTVLNAYSGLHGNPDYLRINVEVASTSDSVLHLWLRNFTLNSWQCIDLDPTDGNTPDAADMIGGTPANGGTPAAPGPMKRVSVRVPVTSDHFGTFGHVQVRAATERGTLPTGTNYVYYDLVQVIAEDDVEFSPLDLNFDGVIDCDDLYLWVSIYEAASYGSCPLSIVSLADFNRNGAVTGHDDSAYSDAWLLEETCPE